MAGDLLSLAADFRVLLVGAQHERPKRLDLVVMDGELEPAWAGYERSVLHRAVNRARAEAGLDALPLDAIVQVELLAAGHSDYVDKFAFYCAELTLTARAQPGAAR